MSSLYFASGLWTKIGQVPKFSIQTHAKPLRLSCNGLGVILEDSITTFKAVSHRQVPKGWADPQNVLSPADLGLPPALPSSESVVLYC